MSSENSRPGSTVETSSLEREAGRHYFYLTPTASPVHFLHEVGVVAQAFPYHMAEPMAWEYPL